MNQIKKVFGGFGNQLKHWTQELAFQTCGLRKLTSKTVKFNWNEDLQQELEGFKAKMKEHINICPVDVNKEIHAHIDAAQKTGMSYLVYQPRTNNPADGKTMISCNRTTFSDAQKRYSPFEWEALYAVWLCRSEDKSFYRYERVKGPQ